MIYSVVGELPRHLYVVVDSTFTHREPVGWIPAVWFGLVSMPGRAWGCTVMLESGAIYRNLPPHALGFGDEPEPDWTIQDAQTWDCYGREFSPIEYGYLAGLDCLVRANGREHLGEYLFTVAPVGDGFSAYPEQAKEFSFVRLRNGRLTVQPTNHLAFVEKSFTPPAPSLPRGLKRQTDVASAEALSAICAASDKTKVKEKGTEFWPQTPLSHARVTDPQ